MDNLEKNMRMLFGKKGEDWLAQLPYIVGELADYWGLEDLTPVENMSFNYVAKANRKNQPVILKINYEDLDDEARALTYFSGEGSIELLDHHPEFHALMLQQAVPGISLTSLYATHREYVMDSYIATMNKLHHKALPKTHQFKHIREWLEAIDHVPQDVIPSHLLKNAVTLKNKLLSSMKSIFLLHGDLHHDNILQNQDQWIAVDPKGVVGEPEFEIAAFDFMYVHELAQKEEIKNILEERIKILALKSHLDSGRIRDWIFVRLILMAAWQIEDHENPKWTLKLAERILVETEGVLTNGTKRF